MSTMSNDLNFKIQFDWRVTALALLFLPVLLSLGFWQLDRAEEKRQLQQLFAKRESAGPISVEMANPETDLRFQPVSLQGQYIEGRDVLLDNRIFQGRFGYEVVSPFRLAGKKAIVWVNRGWVEGDKSRRSLPVISYPQGVMNLSGEIHVPQGQLLILAHEEQQNWPRVMQSLDIDALKDAFEEPVFPYSVRLRAFNPGSFEPSWVVVNIQPEKHTGYAVQWFAMSLTAILIALLGNTNAWAWLKSRRQGKQ